MKGKAPAAGESREAGGSAACHGQERGSVSYGVCRVAAVRRRTRAVGGFGELPVSSYDLFSSTSRSGGRRGTGCSLLCRPHLPGRAGAGGYPHHTDGPGHVDVGDVAPVRRADRGALAADPLALDLVRLMVETVHFGEHTCVVALGIDADGVGHPFLLSDVSTDSTNLVTDMIVGSRGHRRSMAHGC